MLFNLEKNHLRITNQQSSCLIYFSTQHLKRLMLSFFLIRFIMFQVIKRTISIPVILESVCHFLSYYSFVSFFFPLVSIYLTYTRKNTGKKRKRKKER